MIELNKTVYEFKYDDVVYKLSAPTVKAVENLQSKMKGKSDDDANIEDTVDFLAELGLPKDICYGMEASNLEIIVNTVSGVKNG